MELYDVMRTVFAAREFTDDPVPDEVLTRIFDHARFAPSGGNRQGGQVIVVRDQATKDAISEMTVAGARRYTAQVRAGENPWNTWTPTAVSDETIAATQIPPFMLETVRRAPVVIVVAVDLRVVAPVDQYLPRVGLVTGGSIYPLAWNIILAAHNEGYGGTLTTMPIAEEPRLQEVLGLPPHIAVAAIIPMGRPVKRLTKLRRKPVTEFVHRDRFDGEPW